MKKIAFWNMYPAFANNKLFDKSAYPIGEDLWASAFLLKEELEKRGFVVETFDMDTPCAYEHIIFFDYPPPDTCPHDITQISTAKKHIIICECEMIYKPNANPALLNSFNTVFTYDDYLVEKYGYVKMPIPNKLKQVNTTIPFGERKFCTMMAGNKISHEAGELYSERIKTIDFFAQYYPHLFDLYGTNWDKKALYGLTDKIFNNWRLKKIRCIRVFLEKIAKICGPHYPFYRGKVDAKLPVLSQYRYAICYENTQEIKGYISEKIFDCFFTGTIPIYWGCDNVYEYIPEICFIDRRKFKDNRELADYLLHLTENDYNRYLAAIIQFLQSDQAYIFSDQYFVKTVINTIL